MVVNLPVRASLSAPRRGLGRTGVALAALRRATHGAHEALEVRSPLLRDHVTVATYTAYLQAIEPLVAVAEALAADVGVRLDACDYDFAGVCRHAQLQADLAALGAPVRADGAGKRAAYASCLKAHATVGGRLGVLYVLEGSTLGGQLLCCQLRRRLDLRPGQLRYLAGHGRATGPRWRATRALLEAALATPERRAQANAAATATFHLFARAVAGRDARA